MLTFNYRKSTDVFSLYLFRSFDINAKPLHELQCLFVVLVQYLVPFKVEIVVVSQNSFDSGVGLHPFVLLYLFDCVSLVWIFDEHVSN